MMAEGMDKGWQRTGRMPVKNEQQDPFLFDSRSYCASCGSRDDLVQDNPDSLVVFCRDCAAPMSGIEFPEYYCDLGGGD